MACTGVLSKMNLKKLMNSDKKKVIKPNSFRKMKKKKSGTAKTEYETLSTTEHCACKVHAHFMNCYQQ
jgi:hypothetical protein